VKRLSQLKPEFISQSVALACTAGVFLSLLAREQTQAPPVPVRDPGVRISLLEEIPAPPVPPVEPAKPQPHAAAAPHRAAPAAALPAPVVTDPAPADDIHVIAAAEPAAPSYSVSHASIEAAYAAALRENVDARTEVPNTPEYRLLKPSGAAQVRFTLDRVGNPREVAVSHNSGSKILDVQALRIVASGHYPPFPDAAFPGEQRHVFVVTIEFRS
jgi:periplasmic protein TonB